MIRNACLVCLLTWVLLLTAGHRRCVTADENLIGALARLVSTADRKEAAGSDDEKPVAPPAEPVKVDLTSEMKARRARIHRCLAIYFNKYEVAEDRSPWGIMHALIAYGTDTLIYSGGRKVNAIQYLSENGSGRGQRLFNVTGNTVTAPIGPGVQGHEGQFLAMLAQSNVPIDQPMRLGHLRWTVRDLVRFEMLSCRAGEELTFKLMGISHFVDSDADWTDNQGEQWNISRLIQEELNQPIIGAACGGTHRLMALSYAVARREEQGKPIDGQWKRADQFVKDYHQYTFMLQNPDGSFSTDFFERRAADVDSERRLYTTGHVVEWLAYSLPQDELYDPRMVQAVDYLVQLMLTAPDHELEVGPRGHALRALRLYEERALQGSGQWKSLIARYEESDSLFDQLRKGRRGLLRREPEPQPQPHP